jgi:hypothetical protein
MPVLNEPVEGVDDGQKFYGVSGTSVGGNGVVGKGNNMGVSGESTGGLGVYGTSSFVGVYGGSAEGTGVEGASNTGIGIVGSGGRLAGSFRGDVEVTGDIRLLGADCAEEFDTSGADKVEPGTVMVLSSSEGALEVSSKAYDKRVAGIASGAGGFKPGIVLDKKQLQEESNENKRRMPIAMMGKVYCKVDATYSPIEVGDLLTTSPTLGHAMKADDPIKAFGSVIGKALRSIRRGKGVIPVLVALQ